MAGLAIIQAIWLADRYPHRQKAIDRITVLIGGGLMMAVAYTWYGPPFGIGTEIESGYIERPQQGYAITLPLDWRVEDLTGVEVLFGETLEPGVQYSYLRDFGFGTPTGITYPSESGGRLRRPEDWSALSQA